MNIKELAEQAGLKIAIVLRVCGEDLTEWQQEHWAQLEKFAELVAAAERAACIKLLEDFSKTDMVPVKDTWRMGLIAGANAIRGRTE